MLAVGEKFSDLMLQKERKEFEKMQCEADQQPGEEEMEGKLFEIEDEIEKIDREIQMITEELDSMDETLEYRNKKINELYEEIAQNDLENVEPLKFSGL